MGFSKSYAKTTDKSVYPKWVEIILTEQEESDAESLCREKNILTMKQCIEDARLIVKDHKLFEAQANIVQIALSLFDKRASHEVFFKENKTKEKFDKLNLENNQ